MEPEAAGREVLTELARGFLLGLGSEDPRPAARFASQFLTEQAGIPLADRRRPRPRTARGPLPRAFADGRMLEPTE